MKMNDVDKETTVTLTVRVPGEVAMKLSEKAIEERRKPGPMAAILIEDSLTNKLKRAENV